MKQLLVNISCPSRSLEIEDFLKMLHLFLKFLNVSIISSWKLIRLDFNHDLFRSISKLQSRNCFFNVIDNGGNGCNQRCLGVSSQWILKETGYLRITIWNMSWLFALSERLNDFAEWCQRQVNRFELKQVFLVHTFFLSYFLRACQVT